MKNIKEKELLVNFARSMGQAVDPELVKEVDRIKSIKASVRKSATENIFKDLSEAFKQAKLVPTYEPDDGPLLEEQIEQIKETVAIEYPKPPSLDDLMLLLNEKTETVNELVQSQPPEIPVAPTEPVVVEKTLADRTSDFISKSKDSYQQPDPLIVASDMDAVTKKLRFLEQWISKISMAGTGGGEVNLRYLDDVNRSAIDDDKYLRYEASTNKFTFDSGHKNNFYGAFQSTETQLCNANTATALTYNQIDFSYGITVQNTSQVHIATPGLYNAQFSVQLTNSGTAIDQVYIWLRQEGVDVVGSAGKIDISPKHGSLNGAMLIGWNFFVQTTVPNEHFQFMWFTPDETHVTIPTLPEQAAVAGVSPYIPSTASVVLTVSPVKIDSA